MLQIFFKSLRIDNAEWGKIYPKIRKIAENYPLNLLRLESYDGFSSELDKLHTDIVINRNLPDEHISFWGDGFTCSGYQTVNFYKEWHLQMEHAIVRQNENDIKPITWAMISYRAFSGEQIHANGKALFYEYFNTNYLYGYALLAIGILLENLLPGKVLLVVNEVEIETIFQTKRWTEWILNEKFDMPVYLDKLYILDSLIGCYKTKEELVGRMEMLYDNPFSENMEFAIEHIGYEPSLNYYSRLLASSSFGTFGFSDILQPWMKTTKDIEKTLQLIDKSKQFLLADPSNERNLEEADKYDYSYILKGMLSDFVLWTPVQRERLEIFYTNKEHLETGEENLFGSLMRISGYRVDICPIYATETQLFEAFMFFNPKNGTIYKRIIDKWIEKNKYSYEKTIEKISVMETKVIEEIKEEDENDIEKLKIEGKVKTFVEKHNENERFIFEKALKQHSYAMYIDESIEKLNKTFSDVMLKNGKYDAIIDFYSKDKEEKIKYLKYAVKEKRMYLTASENFEKWIEMGDDIIITYLYFLARTKIYIQELHFARQQIFLNHKYWGKLKKWNLGIKDSTID